MVVDAEQAEGRCVLHRPRRCEDSLPSTRSIRRDRGSRSVAHGPSRHRLRWRLGAPNCTKVTKARFVAQVSRIKWRKTLRQTYVLSMLQIYLGLCQGCAWPPSPGLHLVAHSAGAPPSSICVRLGVLSGESDANQNHSGFRSAAELIHDSECH